MSTLTLRPFGKQDIEFALAQTAREGWDATSELFEAALALEPEGCFIAEAGDRPAGMVTTTRYRQTGWIGNLIVTPEQRRQGLGERLMDRAIAYLGERGVQTIRLEADPPGVRLYRRLGFVDEYRSLRFARAPGQAERRPANKPLAADELPAVVAYDAERFGDHRGQLLAELHGHARATFCWHTAGRISGYALTVPSRLGVRIGPWLADDEQMAKSMLRTMLADLGDANVLLGVPEVNRTAVALLESFGFTRSPSCLRMIRGPRAASGDPQCVIAIANGAMG